MEKSTIERFLLLDIKIKEILARVNPNGGYNYDEHSRMVYAEKLYKITFDIEYYFEKVVDCLQLDSSIKICLSKLIEQIRKKIISCNCNYDKLVKCYVDTFCDMKETTVVEIQKTFISKADINDFQRIMGICVSLNEVLHLFHTYTLNNVNFYEQNMPIITNKNGEYRISLRGILKEEAMKLYEQLNIEALPVSINILSIQNPNKLCILLSKNSEKVSLDVTFENGVIWVSYYISFFNNMELINRLDGVRKVKNSDEGTTGIFVIDYEDYPNELINFVNKIPFEYNSTSFCQDTKKRL